MKDGSAERIEAALKSSAEAARREPSPELRQRITTALGACASSTANARGQAPRLPSAARAWRSRAQEWMVAAAVLAAVGVWTFAFVRDTPARSEYPVPSELAGESSGRAPRSGALAVLERAASPIGLVQVVSATPRAVNTAIDGSLFSELGKMSQDATRVVHFLAGRLPVPLVTRFDEESTR